MERDDPEGVLEVMDSGVDVVGPSALRNHAGRTALEVARRRVKPAVAHLLQDEEATGGAAARVRT